VDMLGSAGDPEKIRDAELPKSFRGFDETATRKLLNEVADVVRSLTTEREQLRRQVESLQAAGGTDVQSPEAIESPEAIGNAILAAKRAGEELIAAAKEEAALLLSKSMEEAERLTDQARTTAAEVTRELDDERAQIAQAREQLDRQVVDWEEQVAGERERLMAEARTEAQAILSASEQRLVDLRDEEEKLRRLMREQHSQVVELLRSALRKLEPPAAASGTDLPTALVFRAADGSRQTTGSQSLPLSEN
jgi:cell division septum initiation protein DivIVA